MRILFVEPDIRTAKHLVEYFNSKHDVAVVGDGQTAVHYLDEKTIDVIVLEPLLPSHNGIELLYELRSYQDLQTIPVVIYSAGRVQQFALSTQTQKQLGIHIVLNKTQASFKQLEEIINELATVTT